MREKDYLNAELISLAHLKKARAHTTQQEQGYSHRDDYYKRPGAEKKSRFNALERTARQFAQAEIPDAASDQINEYPSGDGEKGPVRQHMDTVLEWTEAVAHYVVENNNGYVDQTVEKLIQSAQEKVNDYEKELGEKIVAREKDSYESPNGMMEGWIYEPTFLYPPPERHPSVWKAYMESKQWLANVGERSLKELVDWEISKAQDEKERQEAEKAKEVAFLEKIAQVPKEQLIRETYELSHNIPWASKDSPEVKTALAGLKEQATNQTLTTLTEGVPIDINRAFLLWSVVEEPAQVKLTTALLEHSSNEDLRHFMGRASNFQEMAWIFQEATGKLAEQNPQAAMEKEEKIWEFCLDGFKQLTTQDEKPNLNTYLLALGHLAQVGEATGDITQEALTLIGKIPAGRSFLIRHHTQMLNYGEFLDAVISAIENTTPNPQEVLLGLQNKIFPSEESETQKVYFDKRYPDINAQFQRLKTRVDSLLKE